MGGFFVQGLLIVIGLFSSFVWLTLLFQFLRGLFKRYEETNASKWTMTALIGAEYILLAFVIYTRLTKPYQLVFDKIGPFNDYFPPNLGINSTIYCLLIVVFVLICITSFRQTLPFFTTNTKSFILLTAMVLLLMYIVNYFYSKFCLHNSVDNTDKQFQLLTWSVTYIFPTILLLFVTTLFRMDRQKIIKDVFYTFLPILIFYAILFYSQTKFIFLTPQEYDNYIDVLGGHG